MKSSILIFLCIFLTFFGFSQKDSIQTFVVKKEQAFLFQGISDDIQNWYFYVDKEGFCYLANLNIPTKEIDDWFEQRKNSENLFKSSDRTLMNGAIFLSKRNEPDVVLGFEIVLTPGELKLVSTMEDISYIFQRLNIQE